MNINKRIYCQLIYQDNAQKNLEAFCCSNLTDQFLTLNLDLLKTEMSHAFR